MLKYEDEKHEIFVQNNVYIKDKVNGNFFKNSIDSLSDEQLSHFKLYKEKVPSWFLYLLLSFTAIMFILNYIHLIKLQSELSPLINGWKMSVIIIIYFLVNILLHELGHILSLRYFGKRFDKIGFKLNFYVFPAMYVQMNDTYMLSKNEKITVHFFGLFINYLIINIVEFINIATISNVILMKAYMFFSTVLVWNLVPMLNSDGYKILIAFLDLDEYRHIKRNHWLILTFQAIGVGIALNSAIHWILYFIH